MTTTDTAAADRATIRDVIESWVIWRDSAQWEPLLALWHEDGLMSATWQQSSAAEFVTGSKAAWARGVDVLHTLGGTAIDLAGDRAVAQTKMTIGLRATVEGVLVDVVSMGRFYDFFERRAGRWGIVMRQPIYERDRMDAVDPAERVTLDADLLAEFPESYRHLAYAQTKQGITVKRDMPSRRGPGIDALYARGRAWLAGTPGHPGGEGYAA